MSAKKGWLIGCGLVVVLCGGGGMAAFFGIKYMVTTVTALTQPPVDAAEKFLALLGEGKTHEAYLSTSVSFQKEQTEKTFTDQVKQLGLTDYQSSSWNNRNRNNDQATLEGHVTTKGGGKVPLTVKLIEENGQWRVYFLSGLQPGVEVVKEKVPSEEELRKLSTESLLDLERAVKAKDFKPFHAKISRLWQQQKTAEELQKTFESLNDQNFNLAGIKETAPIFDAPPAIDKNEMLVLRGVYPLKPLSVEFKLTYRHEQQNWKLFGIEVSRKVNPGN